MKNTQKFWPQYDYKSVKSRQRFVPIAALVIRQYCHCFPSIIIILPVDPITGVWSLGVFISVLRIHGSLGHRSAPSAHGAQLREGTRPDPGS